VHVVRARSGFRYRQNRRSDGHFSDLNDFRDLGDLNNSSDPGASSIRIIDLDSFVGSSLEPRQYRDDRRFRLPLVHRRLDRRGQLGDVPADAPRHRRRTHHASIRVASAALAAQSHVVPAEILETVTDLAETLRPHGRAGCALAGEQTGGERSERLGFSGHLDASLLADDAAAETTNRARAGCTDTGRRTWR
jgi:hypothetical protein